MDARSEGFTVNGTYGEVCSEDAGGGKMDFASAEFWHLSVSRDLGMGGGGFGGATCLRADEVDVEGDAKLVDIGDGSTPEGNSPCTGAGRLSTLFPDSQKKRKI